MNFRERWDAYSRNFTNTTAPIQYEEFVKLEQFGRVLSLPFLLLIFIGLLAFDIQGPAMIAVFASYYLVSFVDLCCSCRDVSCERAITPVL